MPRCACTYCCGPVAVIDQLEAQAKVRTDFKSNAERFSGTGQTAMGSCYVVGLQHSGRAVAVTAGKTILDMLPECGISAQASYEQCVQRMRNARPEWPSRPPGQASSPTRKTR